MAATIKQPKTNDAMKIIHKRYYEGRPERLESLQEERENAEIARKIYDLRKEAGITQKELAERIGTTPSVISRLEDADYDGHSFAMIRRIAAALDRKVRIEFDPVTHRAQETQSTL
ncbi:MAG: helix-turn-helix transcriptional regulator [Candidatus Omnitrophica bacterium]|nr:helix-turn-helix transcriptional regulator [Candidatus Omnitrophota bacterium]